MAYYKKLIGEKCYLSPVTMEDAEKWTEWFNDLEVALRTGHEAYTPLPLDKHRELINSYIQYQENVFTIVDLETNNPIGQCILYDLVPVDGTAQVSITVGEKEYWDNGYGYDALTLLLDYGFNLLNLNNIMLRTYSFNERSISCYKKAGFKEIGRRRQARVIGRAKYDLVYMDILAEEFVSVFVAPTLARAIGSEPTDR